MGTECGSRLGLQSYKELPLAELGKSNRDGKEDSWVSDRDGGLTHSKKTPASDEVGKWEEKAD